MKTSDVLWGALVNKTASWRRIQVRGQVEKFKNRYRNNGSHEPKRFIPFMGINFQNSFRGNWRSYHNFSCFAKKNPAKKNKKTCIMFLHSFSLLWFGLSDQMPIQNNNKAFGCNVTNCEAGLNLINTDESVFFTVSGSACSESYLYLIMERLSFHRVCPRRSFWCVHSWYRHQCRLRPQRPAEDPDGPRSP